MIPWPDVVAVPGRLRQAVIDNLTLCAPEVVPCIDCGPGVYWVRSGDGDITANPEGIWVTIEGFNRSISFECWDIGQLRMEIIFVPNECVGCNDQANAEALLLALLAFAQAVNAVTLSQLGLLNSAVPLKKVSITPRRLDGHPAIAATVVLQL